MALQHHASVPQEKAMAIQQLIQEIAGKKRFINLLTDWGFKTIFM